MTSALGRYMRLTELQTKSSIVSLILRDMSKEMNELNNTGEWDTIPLTVMDKYINECISALNKAWVMMHTYTDDMAIRVESGK